MKLVIEIADKQGYRIEKVALSEQGSFTIGRAWSNHVIVADPYVEAVHLSIQVGDINAEGGKPLLVVSDVDTVNGTEVAKRSINSNSAEYRFGEAIKIGDSELKIYDQALAVEPAVLKSPWQHLQNYLRGSRVLAPLSLGVFMCVAFNDWAFRTSRFQVSDFVASVLGFAIFLLAWSLLLSGISKISKGKADFRLHWSLSCIMSIAISIISLLLGILVFNTQSHDFSIWAYSLVFGAVGLAYGYIVLSNTTTFARSTKWGVSATMVATILVLFFATQVFQSDRERWTANTKTETLSYPPSMLLTSPKPTDIFLGDAASLFDFDLSE